MKSSIVIFIVLSGAFNIHAQSTDSAKSEIRLNPNRSEISTGVLSPLQVVLLGKHKYYLSQNEWDHIDPAWVKAIMVYKGKDATDRFGKLGENGAVEVEIEKGVKLPDSFKTKLKRIKGS
jgi:hypothetical protein